MTQTPPEPTERPNLLVSLLRIARSPATIAVGGTLLALGIAGYAGVQYFVGQKLSPLLEAELSKFLKREVRVGSVTSFSLNRFRLGPSTIPPTPTDPDSLSVQGIEVGFNPLPLLIGQPLALDVAVTDPQLYVEQDKAGKWLNLELPKQKGELPVDLDVSVRLEDGTIALKPQGFAKPIAINAQGKGRYRKQEKQQVTYDVNAAVLGSQLQIVGETAIETGRTQVDLSLKQLSLTELAFLIPNKSVKLKTGEVASNLTVNFPGFTVPSATQGKGNFSLQQLEATISPLKEPIKANLQLNLQGQTIKIEQGKANLGKLNAQLQGNVGWKEGYDLKLAVKPFRLEDLSKTLALSLPLKVAGEVESQLSLTGSLVEPRLKGTFRNTKTLQIDRTFLKEIRADFQADLNRAVLTKLQISPSVGGQLSGSGMVKTGLKQALEAKKALSWQKMPFSFKLNGQLPAEKLLDSYYRLPAEFALGNLATQGQIGGTLGNPQANLKWQLSEAKFRENEGIKGRGEILLSGTNFLLRDTAITANRGTINLNGSGSFVSKRWQADLRADSLILTPFLAPVCQNNCPATSLETVNAKVLGRLDNLNLAAIQGAGNLQISVNNRPSINSAFIIENSKFNATAAASQLDLNPFISNLTAPVALRQGRVNLSGSLTQLLQGDGLNLAGIKGDGSIQLVVNNQPAVNSEFSLNNSAFKATAAASQLDLNPFIPNLTAPVALRQGRVNLSGSLAQLLQGKNLNLAGLKGDGNIQLAVNNQPAVNSEFSLNNSAFTATVTANELELNPFIPNLTTPLFLRQGQVNLSGSIPTSSDRPFPIQIRTANLQMDGQKLNAKGNLTLVNLTSAPDIGSLNLDLIASSNLSQLPFNSLLSQLPNQQFLPQALDVKGNAQFQGNLSAIREQGTGNRGREIGLKGNLQLDNFNLNGRQFEPSLKGTVKANLGKGIALNLRGKEDIIAAVLDPCTSPRCPAPYLPASLEIRQTFGQQQPLIASGKRQGDRFQAQIEKLPLAWLNIDPTSESALPGFLGGELSATLDLSLFSWEGSGKLKLKDPSFGLLQGQEIVAEVSLQDSVARLAAARLQLGESQYHLAGALNLKTGEVQGKLDVERGRLQDLVAALKASDWESLRYWLRLAPPPAGRAAQVQPEAAGDPDAPLAAQLKLLAEIDRQIREMAAKLQAGSLPEELKLAGDFSASATLAGTLRDPQLSFQLEGSRWQWYPQQSFPDIIQPLGLVIEDREFQPINEVLVRGSFAAGTLQLEPARVKLHNGIITAQGSLSLRQSDLNWRVQNLSLDTLRNFAPIPLDIAGNIQAAGKLTGPLYNPQVAGEFAFTDGAVNASLLGLTIGGDLSYRDARFALKVTEPASISLNASIPFPVLPQENDRFDITLKLGTEAIALIGPLTQNQVTWQGGEGQLDFQAQGRLNVNGTRLSEFKADGKLVLQDAILASTALPQPLTIGGEIAFTPERLMVERLAGEVANSKFSAAGVLPIQEPLKASDPDAANPLTVAIAQGKVQLEGLYRGEVGGQVTVRGNAFSPVLSGDILIANGQVTLPEVRQQVKERLLNLTQEGQPAPPVSRWLPQTGGKAAFTPRLEDLQVSLAGLAVELVPFYRFEFGGKLTLNGPLDNFDALKASGAIALDRGIINLFETRFLLDRRHDNQIAFSRNQSIFDPNLNIKLRTVVSAVPDVGQQRRSTWSNEIPDDSLNKIQRVDISLGIDGPLSQLLPNFGKETAAACQFRDENYLIPANPTASPEEWQQFSRCFQNFARRGAADELLLSNPIVSLTSTPPRSEGQIIRLLGDQIFAIAEALQGGNTEELVRFGIVQLGLGMAFQSVLYDVESAIGDVVGAADFRIVPFLEPVYQVEPQGFIRLRYDYSFNEVRIEYEKRF